MSASTLGFRAWRWRVFAATWAAYAGYYFGRKPFYMTKAALSSAMGWDAPVLARLGAAYLIAYMLGQFLAGWAGTRWGPRLSLLVGLAVTAGCNLAFGFTNSAWTFGALLVVNGLAQATGWSSCVGTMSAWYARRERGTVMGVWSTNFQFGGIVGSALAAWSAGAFGYRWAYVNGAAVVLLAWAVVLAWQRDTPEAVGLSSVPDDPDAPAAASEVGWTRAAAIDTAIVGVFYFFVKFVRYALWSWAPYVLEQRYRLGTDDAGYLATLFDVAGIAGVLATGYLSDRWFGGRRAGLAFLCCAAMCGACVLTFALADQGPVWFAVGIAAVGFFLFGPDTLMSGAGAAEVGSRKTAIAATGIINGMGSAGSVLQELVFGALLAGGGTALAFGTLAASSACATAAMGILVVRGRLGQSRL